MEFIAEFIVMVLAFIFEVTIHALVFICLMVMSIFSPVYRQKLKDDWKKSAGKRLSIVLGVCFYSVALAVALFVWVPVWWTVDKVSESTDDGPGGEVQLSIDEDEKGKTRKLVKVAGDFIKRKLEEKSQEESAGGEP